MRTSYFSGNTEEEKVLEYFSCFTKVCPIQNTRYSKSYSILDTLKVFWFTVDSSVLLNVGVHFFFHEICNFLFVLLIVNLAGISSPPCYKSFEYFLPSLSRQDIVNWIAEGINYFKNHPDVIENSFRVCEITTNDRGKVKKWLIH